MKERQYLKDSILLCSQSDGGIFQRTFSIVKIIDEGTSAICYEAYHQNSGRGVLKEFFPQDINNITRSNDGQLNIPKNVREQFLEREQEYVEPYETMLKVKQNEANQDLASFIPVFEIYHGCSPSGNAIGTTYIWTPHPSLLTFDRIIEDIHKNPGTDPEHKLVTVLLAIESLTKCICTLHGLGMVHRDIKPSNFGFVKRGEETLTQTISLFDINSVCSVYNDLGEVMGSPGYMEPESGYESINNQTDIYSIGATLFSAIAATKECADDGYIYQADYYDRLHSIVDESELISASESNSHPRLRSALTTILKRSLCTRSGRYSNCEELIEDLKKALYYALPSEFAQKTLSGEKWILTDVEKSLDANKDKNSFLAIQYHLFEFPLYRYLAPGETEITISIIGFGNYGQKFLDACIQAGQMRGTQLKIDVYSDSDADKDIYLAERPALTDFFCINGHSENTETHYGCIHFHTIKLNREKRADNVHAIGPLFQEHTPHYIFIALGDDELNHSTAITCQSQAKASGSFSSINFVTEKELDRKLKSKHIHPLHVNKNSKQSRLYPDLERMAFNVHLIWQKDLNVSNRSIRSEFQKPYNHDACIANVLSIKYKLFSVGINLDNTVFELAAQQFHELLMEPSNRGIIDELIWMEHKRWVTEKLCNGWTRLDDLDKCTDGTTKDNRLKQHICIVKSEPNRFLFEEFQQNGDFSRWDSASPQELEALDELDRLSVELHRTYSRKADHLRTNDLIPWDELENIQALVESDKAALNAFREWAVCIREIWNGNSKKVNQYAGLKAAFIKELEGFYSDIINSVHKQIEVFESAFYPVKASVEYRDWKNDDVALVDSIPFILTYREYAHMVIPLMTGKSANSLFENVASSSTVNPTKILYLSIIENSNELQASIDAVERAIDYLDFRRLKASVEIVFLSKTLSETAINAIETDTFSRINKDRLEKVTVINQKEEEDCLQELKRFLRTRSVRKQAFLLEFNDSKLSGLIYEKGFDSLFPSFRYDSKKMAFEILNKCNWLSYIPPKHYLTVSDIAILNQKKHCPGQLPEYYEDHHTLWETYDRMCNTWQLLCDKALDYSLKNDLLISFQSSNHPEKERTIYRYSYIVPYECRKAVNRIISFLVSHNLLEANSRLLPFTSDSCKVLVESHQDYRRELDDLFSNQSVLMQPYAIDMTYHEESKTVDIVYDNLVVNDLSVSVNKNSELHDLFCFFTDKGYILNLSISEDGSLSFTYATRSIKRLLTHKEDIINIALYHQIKEANYFDDIANVPSADYLMTKGLQSVYLKVSSIRDLQEKELSDFSLRVEETGINGTAVLVVYDATEPPINGLKDLKIVWKPEDISNIVPVIKSFMNK